MSKSVLIVDTPINCYKCCLRVKDICVGLMANKLPGGVEKWMVTDERSPKCPLLKIKEENEGEQIFGDEPE